MDGNEHFEDQERSMHANPNEEELSDQDLLIRLHAYARCDTEIGSAWALSEASWSANRVRYIREHETSGDFFRMYFRDEEPASGSWRGNTNFKLGIPAKERLSRQFRLKNRLPLLDIRSEQLLCQAKGVALLDRVLATMGQGILVGLSWMDAFNLTVRYTNLEHEHHSHFTCSYTAVADRTRQALFILTKYPFALCTSHCSFGKTYELFSPLN